MTRNEWLALVQEFMQARMADAPDAELRDFAEAVLQEAALWPGDGRH